MINRLKKFICICGVCVLSITTLSFATVANAEDYVDNSQEAVYTTAPAVVNTEPVYTQSQEPVNNNVDAYTYAQDYTQAPVVDNYSNDTNTNDDVNTANYNFYDDNGEVSDGSVVQIPILILTQILTPIPVQMLMPEKQQLQHSKMLKTLMILS